MRRFSILLFCLLLSACNGASLVTQWKLRDFKLASTDLSQLRLALRGPDWATTTPENAWVEVSYWRDGEEAQAKSSVLHLQRRAQAADKDLLPQLGGAASFTIIELSPQGLAAARAAQQESAQWRASGAKTRGKLHLSGFLACRRGEIPPGPIPIDLHVHADDEIGWLPLYEGLDLRREAKDSEIAEMLPPCAAKGKAR